MPWGERTVGTDADTDREIVIRVGTGDRSGEALTADADTVRYIADDNGWSENRAFDSFHDHTGDNGRGGQIADTGGDRGATNFGHESDY